MNVCVLDSIVLLTVRCRFLASIIYDLEQAQSGEYNYRPLPGVQAHLLAPPPLEEAEIKKLSLQREPRKK